MKVITSVSTRATFNSGEQGEDEGGGGGAKIGKWMPGGNQESVCSNVQFLYLCVVTN